MDPRVIKKLKHIPVIAIPAERLTEFAADPDALKTYIALHGAANSNEKPRRSKAAEQLEIQQAMLAALPVKREITAADLAVQHQPVRLLPVYQVCAMQQQAGPGIRLTPEQRAANEEIRQRQYKAQIAMLAALTP